MQYDLLLLNVLVVDGSGREPYQADIGILGDRIARIGTITDPGRTEIDAHGAAAAPGFIDVHTHDDRVPIAHPEFTPKLSQGVTSVLTGQCGISLAPADIAKVSGPPRDDGFAALPPPLTLLGKAQDFVFPCFADYLRAVAAAKPSINVVPFVGHTSLRVAAMADLRRAATSDESRHMAAMLDEAMQAGAFGMTSGLYYPPAGAASPEEVTPLLRRVAGFGGIGTAHIRNEGDAIFEALDETLDAARASRLPIVISHLKCASPKIWGWGTKLLDRLDAAAKRQAISFDVYPYEASSTMIHADQIEGATRVMVSWSDPYPEKAGQDLADIAADWCCSPGEAANRLAPGGGIYHKMNERDVARIVAHPCGMIGSDGLPHDAHPHPRLWGTFPRVLGRYVRDMKLLTLAEAVRKMTSLPAHVFGLADRGMLREGAIADITLFNRDLVLDTATYEEPRQLSAGIDHVIVGGAVAFAGGQPTGRRFGRVLRRTPDAPTAGWLGA